jgi:NAD(P)-dependent dehydrogenase (short-subunit alcohol dehydrogenase family)
MSSSQPLPAEAAGTAPGRGRLEGRRVLVVGAGTQRFEGAEGKVGNGRAIAVLAAREGAAVAGSDVDADAAAQTAELIRSEGGTGHALTGDAADPADVERVVAEALERLGGLDGVVLNVGIGAPLGLEGTDAAAWDHTLAVNLRSHFLMSRAALPRLTAGGAIVFVGSIAGLRPGTLIPAYDASKAGVLGLCRHVAQEGARRGIRANVVVPGLVDTPLGAAASAGRPSRAVTPVPLGRQATAWEIAYATVFLLSPEASYVTAQQLVVDGGLTVLAPTPG